MSIEKIFSGDIKEFELLFNEYYERLCYYAFQFIKDKDKAEDIVQELFAKLWIYRQELNVTSSIHAYLYRSVRNSCLNQLKHEQVKMDYLAATFHPPKTESFISNEIDAKELSLLIQSCLTNLPPERRKIFLLSRNEGLTYQEIAAELGISLKTVESQMGKALRFLRERLKDYLVLWIAMLNELSHFM